MPQLSNEEQESESALSDLTTSSLCLEEDEETSTSGNSESYSTDSELEEDRSSTSGNEAEFTKLTCPKLLGDVLETPMHQGWDAEARRQTKLLPIGRLGKAQTRDANAERSSKRRWHDQIKVETDCSTSDNTLQSRKRLRTRIYDPTQQLASAQGEENSGLIQEQNRLGGAFSQVNGLDSSSSSTSPTFARRASSDGEDRKAVSPFCMEARTLLQPNTSLKSRLARFIPQLKTANAELERDSASASLQLDHVSADQECYIEMDLGLGVLKQRSTPREVDGVQISKSYESESDDEQRDSKDHSLIDAMDILQGLKSRQAAHFGIQEIPGSSS